jgi:hypothetical protein
MAIKFLQSQEGPVKLNITEDLYNKMTEDEKKNLELAEDEGYLTSLKSEMGGTKGTVPKKMEVEVTGKALEEENKKVDTDEKKDSGFKTFVNSVGEAFTNIAEGAEKKLETVYDDREKRMMFLSGLNTIIDASSGTIAGGQKKGFLESEAIGSKRKKSEIDLIKAQAQLVKATKGEPPRFRGTKDEAILKNYTPYIDKYRSDRNKFDALDTRYLEAFKLISEGKDIPTGTLESFLFPIEKVLAGTEIGDKLNKYFSDGKLNRKLIDEDNVTFKEILNSASKQAIVSQVKDLYPASDKDIQVLLQGLGDSATTPEALIKLISAQKAASEAYRIEGEIAKSLAFDQGDINFAINARDKSMEKIAEQYNDQVSDEILTELYGSADRSSPFRVASAYFYSTLKPQITPQSKTNFEIFKETTEQDQKNIDTTLTDLQKEFLNN